MQEFLAEVAENHSDVDLHVSLNAAMAHEAVAARDLLQKWMAQENIHVWHGIVEGPESAYGYTERRKLSEIALQHHILSLLPDVALSASPFEQGLSVPFISDGKFPIPTASIFYDAIPARFPKSYLTSSALERYYMRRLNDHKFFDVNLCISEFSRREITDIVYGTNSVNIRAGVSKEFISFVDSGDVSQREPYTLLYVGGFDWRKNVSRVIDAVGLIDNPLKFKIKYVVVGDLEKPIADDLVSIWKRNELPLENLRLLGHVSDRELISLYKSVSAVIQPSIMEGFGLTALEAILCNTPVIAANAGALPEIVINEHMLFNPHDTLDISRQIKALFSGDQNKATSVQQKEHALSFTWERTVQLALEALREAAFSAKVQKAGSLIEPLEKRSITLAREVRLPDEVKIDCFARAEINDRHTPRLIVDTTATIISNAGTGIQRVVTKIAENITNISDDKVDSIIAFSNSPEGWYSVPEGNLGCNVNDIKTKGEKIFLYGSDHVLMLDCSWPFYPYHLNNLSHIRLRGGHVTSCLYDLVPIKTPGFTREGTPEIFTRWFKAALEYSTGFVCISKSVADELIQFLEKINFPKSLKVAYWPLGADFGTQNTTLKNGGGLTEGRRSFLMVGTLEPRKGHKVALDGFDELWRRGVDVQLTLVGKLGWNASHLVARMQSHPEWNKRLFWNSKASDTELQAYYATSDCLLSTSFAEGFGLPIVEAGYFGKPIIASDIPVFREVSSKSHSSRFFEPGNACALANAIESFVHERETIVLQSVSFQRWENWAESAAALKKVILDDKWYHVYQPKEPRHFADVTEAVNIRMNRLFEPHERKFAISVEDGPLSAEAEDEERYVIRVTNLSETIWSSLNSSSGKNAINLGSRLFDRHGKIIGEGKRSSIPYVIVPHDTVYMPIEVPISWKKHLGAKIHVELVQEGAAWWGSPAVIATEDM